MVSLKFSSFENATNLKSVTIPKTLKEGSIDAVFRGCTNLTSIIFQEGLTVIPSSLCENTNIKEITIPDSVKTIECNAFNNCKNLSKINLGNINSISFDAFKNCISLKEIKIPKTLKKGSISPIFGGCTNLTSIVFEEGLTVIPSYLCADTNVEEITIPDSVKTIEYNAFSNCKKLNKVDLGNVESLSFCLFENCASLKEIMIPKTLRNASIDPVFKNCSNLTSIIFEEGITTIPSYLCSGTNIESVIIPKSVKKIESDAFENCPKLEKVTILGNVEDIGWYNLYNDKDTVFTNHIESLTIYCLENSKMAQYAKDTGIKFEYIKQEEETEDTEKENTKDENQEDKNDTKDETNNENIKTDSTTKQDSKLPQTGVTLLSIIGIALLAIAVISKVKYSKFKDIK